MMKLLTTIFITLTLVLCSCKKANDTPTPFSDEFNGTSLNPLWNWAFKPGGWDIGQTRQGWISFNDDIKGNIFCTDESSRLFQTLDNDEDFDVSTRMYCEWGNNASDIAGIIVKFPDNDDWILIKLWMHGDNTGRLEFQTKCDDIISPVPGYSSYDGTSDIYLRIKKTGDNYTGYFKTQDNSNWTTIGTTQGNTSIPIQVGLFAGVDEGTGSLLVQFDYFKVL